LVGARDEAAVAEAEEVLRRIEAVRRDGAQLRDAGRPERLRRVLEQRHSQLCELGHVYHLFVCRSPERDRIRAALTDAGVASGVYYTTPLHLQPALRFLGYAEGSLPETEKAARENFSLPLWAGIDAATQERVIEAARAAAPVAR